MARWKVSTPRWLSDEEKNRIDRVFSKTLVVFEQSGSKYLRNKLRGFFDGRSETVELSFFPTPRLEVSFEGKEPDLDDVLLDVAPRLHEAILARQLGAICVAGKPSLKDARKFESISSEPDATYIEKNVDNRDIVCNLPASEVAEVPKVTYIARKYRLPSGETLTEVAMWYPYVLRKLEPLF